MLLSLLYGHPSLAQEESEFLLGFRGPRAACLDLAETLVVEYECTLTQENVPPPGSPTDPVRTGMGAQGWSISVVAEPGRILAVTTDGTVAAPVDQGGLYFGGFHKTELTSGAGNEGAVSAVALSFAENRALPENTTYVIARLQAELRRGDRPLLGLRYRDGLVGSGEPVVNTVTQGSETRHPVLGRHETFAQCDNSCCDLPLNVGFSAEPLLQDVPREGLLDESGEATCWARGGLIALPSPFDVYVGISSNLPGARSGPQAWSLSLRYQGDLDLTGATTRGTSVDTYLSELLGGFAHTELIDPALPGNAGREGVVSIVSLSAEAVSTLPVVGTHSVLKVTLEGGEGHAGRLWFESGLQGQLGPADNGITVEGVDSVACNVDVAEVGVQSLGPRLTDFIRGDANSDGRVDISDAIRMLSALFQGGAAMTCQDAADVDDDGKVNITDPILLLEHKFRNAPPPPEPFPDCGPERTPDALSCEGSAACE